MAIDFNLIDKTRTDPVGSIVLAGKNRNAGKSTLGADDFMKLLVTQLSAQDPMKPMEDKEFISQMANFTSLEQMRALNTSFGEFSTEQRFAGAQAYLGKDLTVYDPDLEADVKGICTSVLMDGTTPCVVVNGKTYNAQLVTATRVPGTTTPETPATTEDTTETEGTAPVTETQP